ncbi:MAG: hypothetical protein HY211_02425 [Candidatus Omnitrophica bacterium]|nr:hypothetical protein [Candidatus Omnitrophota bacterium]
MKRQPLSDLVEAFFAAQPWRQIGNQPFGLALANDPLAYFASIMGSGGMEHGLFMVKGWESYHLLRGMLKKEVDENTARQGIELLSVSAEAELPPRMSAYARRKDLKEIPHLGWPMVAIKRPHQVSEPPDPADEGSLCRCLEVLVHLAKTGQLQLAGRKRRKAILVFEAKWEGPTLSVLPSWKPIPTPPPLASVSRLTEELRRRLSRFPRLSRSYLIGFDAGGVSVRNEIPRMLLIYDLERDKIVLGEFLLPSEPDMLGKTFHLLTAAFEGYNLLQQRGIPSEIQTDSKFFYDHFKSDLSHLGIRLLCLPALSPLDALRAHFSAFAKAGPASA